MKRNTLIGLGILAVLIAVGVYAYYMSRPAAVPVEPVAEEKTTVPEEKPVAVAPVADEWTTYNNVDLGLTFKYPKGWKEVDYGTKEELLFRSPDYTQTNTCGRELGCEETPLSGTQMSVVLSRGNIGDSIDTPESYVNFREEHQGGYGFESNRRITLDGQVALLTEYNGNTAGPGATTADDFILVVAGFDKDEFSATISGVNPRSVSNRTLFDHFLASVHVSQ